jgi:hypothetical protein
MVDQFLDLRSADSDDSGCAHHWQIATPAGESSEGHCKFCGATRSFLNYSQRRTMTRNIKTAAPAGAAGAGISAPSASKANNAMQA